MAGGFGLALWGSPQAADWRVTSRAGLCYMLSAPLAAEHVTARQVGNLRCLRIGVSIDRIGKTARLQGSEALRLSDSQATRKAASLPGTQASSRVAPPLRFLETPALFDSRVSLFSPDDRFAHPFWHAVNLAVVTSRRSTISTRIFHLSVCPFARHRLLPLHGAFHQARLVSTYEHPRPAIDLLFNLTDASLSQPLQSPEIQSHS